MTYYRLVYRVSSRSRRLRGAGHARHFKHPKKPLWGEYGALKFCL
jgi:hypothetical protein